MIACHSPGPWLANYTGDVGRPGVAAWLVHVRDAVMRAGGRGGTVSILERKVFLAGWCQGSPLQRTLRRGPWRLVVCGYKVVRTVAHDLLRAFLPRDS